MAVYSFERDFPHVSMTEAINTMEDGDVLYLVYNRKVYIYEKCIDKGTGLRGPLVWHNYVKMVKDIDSLPDNAKAEIVLLAMGGNDDDPLETDRSKRLRIARRIR